MAHNRPHAKAKVSPKWHFGLGAVSEVLPGARVFPRSLTAPRVSSSGHKKPLDKWGVESTWEPGRIRDNLRVPPLELAEMYKLHNQMRQGDSGTLEEELTDRVLGKVWFGAGGSAWHVSGKMPQTCFGSQADYEQAYNQRGLMLRPGADENPEELLANCGTYVECMKGCKGVDDTELGQDNFCIARLEGGWELYGVFDGHGPDGHWPSARAAQTLPAILQNRECATMIKQGRMDAALIRAFDQVQEDLSNQAWPTHSLRPRINLPFSGCTAVCALRHPSRSTIWTANVGDSRAVLLAPDGSIIHETRDHKPTDPEERKRVEEMGCEVRQDSPHEHRVYIAGRDYPGLLMTRSMGDLVVKRYGVIATPEVVEWSLGDCSGAMLLIASDGLWEFISSQEAFRSSTPEPGMVHPASGGISARVPSSHHTQGISILTALLLTSMAATPPAVGLLVMGALVGVMFELVLHAEHRLENPRTIRNHFGHLHAGQTFPPMPLLTDYSFNGKAARWHLEARLQQVVGTIMMLSGGFAFLLTLLPGKLARKLQEAEQVMRSDFIMKDFDADQDLDHTDCELHQLLVQMMQTEGANTFTSEVISEIMLEVEQGQAEFASSLAAQIEANAGTWSGMQVEQAAEELATAADEAMTTDLIQGCDHGEFHTQDEIPGHRFGGVLRQGPAIQRQLQPLRVR